MKHSNAGGGGWRFLPFFVALSGSLLFAQPPSGSPQPDCIINVTFTAVNQTAPTAPFNGLQNTNAGCTTWSLSVNASALVTAYTVALQSAPNTIVAGASTPGTYVTFANQTIIAGANPIVVAVSNGSGFVYLQGYNPWVRVQVTSFTGSGTINGAAYGWRIPSASASGLGTNVNATIVAPLGLQAESAGVSVTQATKTLTVTSFADVTGDGSAHAISGSGTARWCDVSAPSANTATARTGDSAITTSRGQIIAPGGTYHYEVITNDTYSLAATFYLAAVGDKLSLLCGN